MPGLEDIDAATGLDRARLASVLQSLAGGVLLEDEDRRIVLANDAFCRMFHMPPPDQVVGMDCSGAAELAAPMFTDPAGFVARIEQLLAARVRVLDDLVRTVDGRVLERDYVPFFVDGAYRGHLWHYRDVTERERARDAAMARLSEQNARELAMMSHDVRSPLQTILARLDLAALEGLALPPTVQGHIEASVRQIIELLDDQLLTVGPEGGPNRDFDIAQLCRDVVSHRRDVAGRRGLALLFEGPEFLRVHGPPTPIRRILTNLVDNALKYTERGGIRVTLSAVDGETVLWVRDTGPGISDAVLEQLQEPFVQGDRRSEGVGLGLHIVRRLVDGLGGRLQVEPGPGGAFGVFLPLQAPD